MNSDIAIKVSSVNKDFLLPHEKTASLKSGFTSFLRPKDGKVEKQHALKGISFEIQRGEFFGIVGRNGSGKSTLLKIIAGIYQPTEGSIGINGRLVPFIELGVGFNPELTGKENIYLNGAMLGFSERETRSMYDEIVEFAELKRFMDQKLKNYSSGMQVRLAFSMATRAQADILLVDEVLAVGDAAFQRKCYDYFKQLKQDKKTVIFVTHDMNAIREYCDRVILLEASKLIGCGRPEEMATMYTRLLAEDDISRQPRKSKRWGDGTIRYASLELSHKKMSDQPQLKIHLTAEAKADIDNPNFGFLIKNGAGVPVLGTNTQIKQKPIKQLKRGQKIKLEWQVPNIFSDGTYFIDPAIVYKAGNQVADWWEEAATFQVTKEEKTPYVITPSISVSHEVV